MEQASSSQPKQRHGCLTAFLILVIVVNSVTALFYLLSGESVQQAFPDAPGWFLPVLAVASIFNVICAIALFQWKKWGFFGFIGSSVLAFIVNLTLGLNIVQLFMGLAGVAVLYWVLQIGKEIKGWTQLE
jgi:hypothetical protein